MRGLAAAVFLGMTILFLGIAVMGGGLLAWLMVVANGALFVANLAAYMSAEPGREKPPAP
jgi:hypothetical protein